MNKEKISSITLCGVFAALTAVGAQISMATPSGVNFTLQMFVIAIFSYALSPAEAVKTTAVYIALGAIGLPVFTNVAGGPAVLAGPTGGFIWGFLIYSLLCSVKPSSSHPRLISVGLGVLGTVICHLMGVIQYCLYKGDKSFAEGLLLVSLPFIVKDLVLTAAAYGISIPVKKMTDRARASLGARRRADSAS